MKEARGQEFDWRWLRGWSLAREDNFRLTGDKNGQGKSLSHQEESSQQQSTKARNCNTKMIGARGERFLINKNNNNNKIAQNNHHQDTNINNSKNQQTGGITSCRTFQSLNSQQNVTPHSGKTSTMIACFRGATAIAAAAALVVLILISSTVNGQHHHQMTSGGMQPSGCQYHQAMLMEAAARGDPSARSHQQQQQLNNLYATRQPNQMQLEPNVDHLLVCPLSSQYNSLPQFPAQFTSPSLKRQQRLILSHLNASFSHHLPLVASPDSINGHPQVHHQSAGINQLQQQDAAASSAPIAHANPINGQSPVVDDQLINEIITPLVVDAAYESAKEQLVRRRKLEKELIRQGFITDMSKPTAVARHQRVTTTTSRGNELEKEQEIFEEMSRILAKNLTQTLRRLTPSELSAFLASSRRSNHFQGGAATGAAAGSRDRLDNGNYLEDQMEAAGSESVQLLSRIDLHSSEARHAVSRCEEDQLIICDPNFPYRHADGRCNNLEHPSWGKANTCFARLLPPDYSDGQSAPRISVTGNPLPNPRILSAIVHRDFNYPATYTHFVMQYGQFFAHDIAFTPSSRTKSGQMIQCCPIERDSHPQCFPILVPPDDPFYSNWEESCLNFVRTAVCPRCRLGPREQMNQITSFIDGSQVYGSAANETAALWTKSGPAGRMHVSLDDAGRELLPHSADPSADQCSDVEKRQFCYRAGDRRVNQHPALTSVHVMWLRQHNRIVNALKMHNPHWNGDRLYQEAKRICGAQMQMVTYNEWLSLIIGQDAMKFLKLNVLPTGYTKYDPSVDPSLLNEFSGSAFRFGHSMINNIFAEILPDGRPSGYRLNEFFFHPFGMKSGQYDMVMRGLISQASQNRDPFVSSDIKNHLYRPRDNPYGLDLPAFNIQRGRDHGIPGYTKLVQFCFDDTITNWKQLDQYMPVSQRIRFSKLYRSVHDLDLFSAGLAEYPLPGAALGPTFTCIVGIQMFNLKYGDRFWFEHGGQVGSFTPDQLQELRKTNLARLICANSDNINVIQRNTFRGESPSNPSVPCSSLPDTDLKAWTEAPGTQNVFTSAMNSPAQHAEFNPNNNINNNDRRAKRGERSRPSVDNAAVYQQEVSYNFRSTKKQSVSSKVKSNSYSLAQVHPEPQQPNQQHPINERHQKLPMMRPDNHQSHRQINAPKSFKSQYKYMMMMNNNVEHRQNVENINSNNQTTHANLNKQQYNIDHNLNPPSLPISMEQPIQPPNINELPNLMDSHELQQPQQNQYQQQHKMQMYMPIS